MPLNEYGIREDSKDDSETIQKEAEMLRGMRFNIHQKKIRDAVQSNEQTKINKYHEGFCYGCAKTDQNISTLFYICGRCRNRRGMEGLMAVVYRKKSDELCDICGRWEFDVWQINASLCRSCMVNMQRIHKKYRRTGGYRTNNPFLKKMARKLGKNWEILMKMPNARHV